jgi:hypothetical protein
VCVECLCGVRRQEIVVINGMILFSYADYKMIVKLTSVGSLTTSSAGITVCSFVFNCQAG